MDPIEHIGIFADPDYARDAIRATSACPSCGASEPARLGDGGCSDCIDYPRCGICSRWVGDGSGWLPGFLAVDDGRGGVMRVCEPCWEKAE